MLPTISQEDLKEDASNGVQLAWDMLMVHPPAIACTPKKYTKLWHIEYGPHWNPSKPPKTLVYFRPLILLGADTVGLRALVGNKMPSKEETPIRDSSVNIAGGETLIEVCMYVTCSGIVNACCMPIIII